MSIVQRWKRPSLVRLGCEARVHLFVFVPRELDLSAPMSRVDDGLPEGGDASSIDVAYVGRDANAAWVEGFFDASVERMARAEIGAAFDAVKASAGVYALSFLEEEPEDLGYLQVVWAFARHLGRLGATAVLDAQTHRWWSTAALIARSPDRPFAIEDEIAIVVEDDGTGAPGYVHTRGMVKFGRPDVLVADVAPPHRARAIDLLQTLAGELARGAALVAGDAIALGEGPECSFRDYLPGEADPDLRLSNEALVLAVPSLSGVS